MKIGADRLSSEVTVQLTCAFVFSICENQDFSLPGSGIERGYIFFWIYDRLLYWSCRERVCFKVEYIRTEKAPISIYICSV